MTRSRMANGGGPGPNRLYRNTDDGMLFGVCAGFADYFGFDLTITRVITVIGGFIFFPTVPVAYVILGLLLQPRPQPEPRHSREDFDLRRRVRAEPHATLNSVRHRFRDLERRLQRLERVVTSKRYRLEREFDGLKDAD